MKKVGKDKWKHFGIGALVAMFFGWTGAFCAACGWEACDVRHGGIFDIGDVFWTMLGSLLPGALNAWLLWQCFVV